MDIMSLFRGTPAATPAPGSAPTAGGPTQVAQPGTPLPGTSASAQTAPNGTVPTQPATTGTEEPTPFDAFKDLWQTPSNATENNSGPLFDKVNPADLLKSAAQVDFARAITPEIMQAIQAGGEGATKALAAAMNSVAQQSYAQSAFATTKIVDQAVAKMQERFDAQLPTLITKHSVNSGLADNNPLLSNPAVAPLFSAMSDQLLRKNPNATPAEIQMQINDYAKALGVAFAPKVEQTSTQKAAAKSEDWGAFFES
jgi:hypothetical protein